MIIRILGEGQYTADDALLDELNQHDAEIEMAAKAGNQERLTAAIGALLNLVRTSSTLLPDDVLSGSDLILPDESATVEQILQLLEESGDFAGIIPDTGV